MKKSIVLIIFITTFFCAKSFSQTIVFFADKTFTRENGLNKANNSGDTNIEGSKFIKSHYQQANISTHPNILFNVRYNAYNDDIEIEGKENTSYSLNKYSGTIIVTMLTGETYINAKYIDNENNINTGFFEVLKTSGEFFLLKKQTITIKEKEEAKTTYHQSKPAKYKKSKDEYYIKTNNLTATKIPKKNKDFANLFPNKKDAISKFIKDEKIKLKKEEDLIKVFKYIEDTAK
ncbi:hypothetical protein [Olleya sp. Bg11-27]|uniref:hypothetical protein n=1 Tax=Olleya sp. Bg11-27 TaxID=2058135 RepID=UPI000C30EA4E|nr:hypothetical protein [Olleya sp. Bg11-27]AUC74253.1 hypothetical protein CW732_00590 [Olleya sp. Bg11-27]